jgi:hypothetical protein
MTLHLPDEQAVLLLAELDRVMDGARSPLSARIRALREIRVVLKPYPERPPPAPPQKPYEPPGKEPGMVGPLPPTPSRGRYKRR